MWARGGPDQPADLLKPPRRGLLFLESRALLELVALVPAYPFLRRAPSGDGHPVLVLPGFTASDFSTRAMRRFLRYKGYAAHGWGLGRNMGPTPEVLQGIVQRLSDLRSRYGRRVSLIGWSLGGVYARELGRHFSGDVRLVITLASPFRNLDTSNIPKFLRTKGRQGAPPLPTEWRGMLAAPIPVPATAIYSRTDGIVPWQSCREETGPFRENIEVEASHLGIGHHPVVLLTIADRLAQPEGAWTPFRAPDRWKWPLVPRTTD